jgi:hypothetical protein
LRSLARGALSYLACEDDVIDDRLGLVGYLDDNFVVQTAVDLIEPGRVPSLDLLDSITEVWPFVNRCMLNESGAAYPLSEFLMVNSALSCDQLRPEGQTSQTALMLPRGSDLHVCFVPPWEEHPDDIASRKTPEKKTRRQRSAARFSRPARGHNRVPVRLTNLSAWASPGPLIYAFRRLSSEVVTTASSEMLAGSGTAVPSAGAFKGS